MTRRCDILVLVAFSLASVSGFLSTGLIPNAVSQRNDHTGALCGQASKELLEQAAKLREEAEALRRALPERMPDIGSSKSPPKLIKEIEDSTWIITYRFSSNPREKKSDENVDSVGNPLQFYSGKCTVLLKADGYTDLVDQESDGLKIEKVWGWDKEVSSEDDLTYVLFSMDVQVSSAASFERYYLQARLETDPSDSSLSLKEGTVTKKEDVSRKTGGVWGLFSVAGILSEFRYVGDFIARPT